MTVKKSPIHWEELIALDADELRAAFSACAAEDLGWAVDQAKCCSFNLPRESEKASIVREFCDQAAGQAISQGAIGAAITALEIVADVQDGKGDERAREAVAHLRQTLNTLAETDRDRALGVAVLIKARSWQNDELTAQIVDFILTNAADDADGMLMNVIRGGEKLPPAALDRVIAKTETLAVSKPYEARIAAAETLGGCENLSDDQRRRLSKLNAALSESPVVLREVLKREYGEGISALPKKAERDIGYVHPAPRYLQ